MLPENERRDPICLVREIHNLLGEDPEPTAAEIWEIRLNNILARLEAHQDQPSDRQAAVLKNLAQTIRNLSEL